MPERIAWTIKELAAALNLSAKTIHRMIEANLFPRPIYPTEGKPLWTAAQIETWVRAKEAGLIPPLPRKARQENSEAPRRARKGPGRENSDEGEGP